MKNNFATLAKDIIAYGVMGGVSTFAGIILLPIFTHIFETVEYGVLEIAATLTILVATCIRFSLTQSLARYYNECDSFEEKTLLSSTVWYTCLVFGLLVNCIVLLNLDTLAHLLFHNRTDTLPIILCGITGALSALAAVPLTLLRLQRRIFGYNISNFLHTVTYALLALAFVIPVGMNIVGVLLASLVATGIQLVIAVGFVRSHFRCVFSRDMFLRCIRFSAPIFPSVLLGWVSKHVDRYVILTFLGLSGVGIYGAGAKLAGAVLLATVIFRQAWNPLAMQMLAEDANERQQFFRLAFNYYSGCFAIIALGLTALSPELFSIFLDEKYHQAYAIVPWVAGAAVMQAAIEFTALGYFLKEKTFSLSVSAFAGTFISITLAILLIPGFGIGGAAIGSFVGALAANVVLLFSNSLKSGIRYDIKVLSIILAMYIAGSLAFLHISSMVDTGDSLLGMRLVLLAILSIVIFLVSLQRSAGEIFRDLRKKSKIKP